MAEPGRITVRHRDGRPAQIPEVSNAVCVTRDGATVRISDSPGSTRWIEADQASVASLRGSR